MPILLFTDAFIEKASYNRAFQSFLIVLSIDEIAILLWKLKIQ